MCGVDRIDTQQMLVPFLPLLASWKWHIQHQIRSYTPLATKTKYGLYRILKHINISPNLQHKREQIFKPSKQHAYFE